MLYCNDSIKATITILNPKQIIKANAPVNIELIEASIEIYVHDTRQPINKTFSRTVNDIALNPNNQTYNNGAVNNPDRACPIPQISGKSILSDFDNYYVDNNGTCSYQVTLGRGISINGKVYPSDDHQYSVSCDDDCPEGSHKCTHNKYPGYCCVPCKEVGDRLKNIASKVRG